MRPILLQYACRMSREADHSQSLLYCVSAALLSQAGGFLAPRASLHTRAAGNIVKSAQQTSTRILMAVLYFKKVAWSPLVAILLALSNGALVSAKDGGLLAMLGFGKKDLCSDARPTLFLLSGKFVALL